MILGEPTASADPAEGSLDDPASRLNCEILLSFVGRDDLDGDRRRGADALASISLVCEAVGQEWPEITCSKSATPPWLSCRLAGETAAIRRRPSVSVRAWRLRPTTRRA